MHTYAIRIRSELASTERPHIVTQTHHHFLYPLPLAPTAKRAFTSNNHKLPPLFFVPTPRPRSQGDHVWRKQGAHSFTQAFYALHIKPGATQSQYQPCLPQQYAFQQRHKAHHGAPYLSAANPVVCERSESRTLKARG